MSLTKTLNTNRIALDVVRQLRKANLQRNTENWQDYETAKRIVFGDRQIDNPERYAIMHKAITDFLRV